MDLSALSSSSGNLSQSKSMHVSELMEDTSAQVRSLTSASECQPKEKSILICIRFFFLPKDWDWSTQLRHSLMKNIGPLVELSYGHCPFRPQCKHGTDTRPIIFVKDIQWKQGRERALNPLQGALGVCTGHTSGSWDNWECLSSFQPLPCIHTCLYIHSAYRTVHTYKHTLIYIYCKPYINAYISTVHTTACCEYSI